MVERWYAPKEDIRKTKKEKKKFSRLTHAVFIVETHRRVARAAPGRRQAEERGKSETWWP